MLPGLRGSSLRCWGTLLLPQLARTGCPGFHVNHLVRSKPFMAFLHASNPRAGEHTPSIRSNLGKCWQDCPGPTKLHSRGLCYLGQAAVRESRAEGAQRGLGVPCHAARGTTVTVWGWTRASEGKASAAPDKGPAHEPAGVLPGVPGGCLHSERKRETERQTCREAGRQTGIQNHNHREVAFCSLGKYLH